MWEAPVRGRQEGSCALGNPVSVWGTLCQYWCVYICLASPFCTQHGQLLALAGALSGLWIPECWWDFLSETSGQF